MNNVHQERVKKVFDRLQNIQSNVDSEKLSKWRLAASIIENLERKIEEVYTTKTDKFEGLNDKIKVIFDHIQSQRSMQQRIDLNTQENIEVTKRNCVNLLDSFSKERDESERRIYAKLNSQIDSLTIEIQREYQAKTASQDYLQTQVEEELPKFEAEIRQESIIREDIEAKIYSQFTEQISELQEMFETERIERQNREEELVNILKAIYSKTTESIARCRADRERSEEMLVRLVEQVIEKIKRELNESEF